MRPEDNKVKKLAILILISLYACQPADQELTTANAGTDASGDSKPTTLATYTGEHSWTYPKTAAIDQSDDHHGAMVAEPGDIEKINERLTSLWEIPGSASSARVNDVCCRDFLTCVWDLLPLPG